MIEQARLLMLKAAYMMDTVGNKAARAEIAMIKVAAPNMLSIVVDRAIQAHGAAGVSGDFGLARPMRRRARFALSTDRTRCTATRSASSNCASTIDAGGAPLQWRDLPCDRQRRATQAEGYFA